MHAHAHAGEPERLQATSAIDTDATANGIQCAVTASVSTTERRRENELSFSQREAVLSYS